MKITNEHTGPLEQPNPQGPFFMLEVTGIDETDGGINTAITMFGFEQPWQREALKSMLEQFAASL